MMPSRGLQAIRGSAPRLYQQQCRNLSSRTLPRASIPSLKSSIRSSPWIARTPGAALSLSAIRFASTTPTTPAPGPASAPQAPLTEPANAAAASSSTPNLDTITLDDVQLAAASDQISKIPEGIGYLKQIGLDYGTGPTSMIEWILEHIHIWGGLPWWGAIAATAVLLRVVTFPLYLKSSDQAARNTALLSVTKPISERMTAAQKAGDQQAVMQAWQEMRMVRKQAGLSYMSQFTPMLIQSVLGYCSFKLMRAMATLPVPGLQDGGFGWITDLTVSDGFLVVPALMAGAMHVMMRVGGESGQSMELMQPGMRSFMLWGMPGIIFLITGWQPACVAIWFAASGAFAMGQGLLLQNAAVRSALGLTPMYKPAAPAESASRTIDTTATPKTMRYQAPNVRTTRSSTAPPTFASPAAQSATAQQQAPSPPQKKGVFDSVKEQWAAVKKQVQEKQAANLAKRHKDTIARAAADYEKRAQRKKEFEKRKQN